MKSSKVFKFYFSNPWRIVQQLKYKYFLKQNPGVPWMAPGAIKFLDQTINEKFTMLEWGSGGSTAWFAKRARKVISIESNISWYDRVSETLKSSGIKNVDYRFIETDDCLQQDECIKQGIVPPYVAVVNAYQENFFDLVVIDGSLRNICINEAPKYIRPGGYLVLDNSNWMSPEKWGIPVGWELVNHHDVGVSCTSIWQKPVTHAF